MSATNFLFFLLLKMVTKFSYWDLKSLQYLKRFVPGLVSDDLLGGVESEFPKSLLKESLLLQLRRGEGVEAVPLVCGFVGVHRTLKISLGGLRTLKPKGNCYGICHCVNTPYNITKWLGCSPYVGGNNIYQVLLLNLHIRYIHIKLVETKSFLMS